METASGKFPAHVSRELLHRWIPILPLNVGDKGIAKIKCRHALSAEVSEMCLRKAKRHSWDLVKRNKIIRGIRREDQNPHFLLKSRKARFWGAIVGTSHLWSTVLAEWTGPMAQWPSPRTAGRRRVWGRSTKVEAEMVLQEELKVIYDRPKPIRGGLKPSYPPKYSFKGTLWRGVEYWIRDEGGE